MPALEICDLDQKAVYWQRTGYDSFGQPTVSNRPIQIPVRWVWKHREVVTPEGNTIAYDAEIAAAQPILVGSHLWLGTLMQWNALHTGASQLNQDLCECKLAPITPDVKGRNLRYTASLMRLHDSGAN